MKHIVSIAAALVAGFAGGLAGTRFARSIDQDMRPVIRARSFELVDEAGQVISLWGVDQGKNVVCH
ncbi:MAG: hypothetical protein IT165_35605 [Bryobacterales bacterium]|nr:hypothetical protein [Bryobacterales bacterium]